MTTQPPSGGGPESGSPKVLGERYEVGALIGRGGMADVRAGHDTRLGRTVAIKRLRSDLASDPTFQARFRREAQSAASLNHPSIVAVYDTGEEVVPDGTHVPYIVMEHVEGRTLREILREGRKLLPERALEITADVLSALDYSHRAGIVHRDIKPANVMLTPTGRVKVMDFGIARAIADASSTMTATAAVVGTAQYLSPEQARGEQVDARSDIYSTGCLLFELLTGRPPFQGDSPVSVAYQHVREEPPPPSSLDPEISPEIDSIVARSLAKKTAERYQSAAQMRADIERVLAGQAVEATTAMPVVAPAPLPPPSQETQPFLPEQDDEEEPKKSRAWIWVLLILVLLLALAGGAYALLNRGGDDAGDVSVPDVLGEREKAAVDAIESEGLVADVRKVESDNGEKGRVLTQDPDAGELVNDGDTVVLEVGAGPTSIEVPDVEGLPRQEAEGLIDDAGLTVGEFVTEPSTETKGTVLTSNPLQGTAVAPETTVVLTVSSGPAVVPDVIDLSQEDAENAIDAAGLVANVQEEETDEAEDGIVFDQDPPADTDVEPGSTVTITVAVAPETTETTTEPTTTTTPTAAHRAHRGRTAGAGTRRRGPAGPGQGLGVRRPVAALGLTRGDSAVQGWPVDELLGVTVERAALDQLEVEVGSAVEEGVRPGLTGDHREDRHLDAVDETGRHQRPVHRQAAVRAQGHLGLLLEPGDDVDGVAAHQRRVRPVEGSLERRRHHRCRQAPHPVVHRVTHLGLLGARAQQLHHLPKGGGAEDHPLVRLVHGEAALEELGTVLAPVAAPVAAAVRAEAVDGGDDVEGVDGGHGALLECGWFSGEDWAPPRNSSPLEFRQFWLGKVPPLSVPRVRVEVCSKGSSSRSRRSPGATRRRCPR